MDTYFIELNNFRYYKICNKLNTLREDNINRALKQAIRNPSAKKIINSSLANFHKSSNFS